MFRIFVIDRHIFYCSRKGQEQVECKFYKELARVLVKDRPVEEQFDTTLEESKEVDIPDLAQYDIPALAQQDSGNLRCSLFSIWDVGWEAVSFFS